VRSARQQGVALITVLLVMTLLTLMVSSMLRSHQGLMGGIRQQIEASRLLQLAYAGERHALGELRQQSDALLQVTHGGQPWARSRALALHEGRVQLRLEDLSGRFNLAALTARKTLDPVLLKRWQRLCRSLQIEPPALDALAGQPLLDPTQLRALPGFSAESMARLLPWVVALPPSAALNINTAPARMLGLLEGVDPSVAQRLVEARPEEGYANVQSFLALPQLAILGIQSHGLTTTSRWFRLEVQAALGSRLMYLYSDMEIDLNTHQVRVVRRVFSAQPELKPDE